MKEQNTRKIQITIPEATYEKVKAASAKIGISISAWYNVAADEKFRRDEAAVPAAVPAPAPDKE